MKRRSTFQRGFMRVTGPPRLSIAREATRWLLVFVALAFIGVTTVLGGQDLVTNSVPATGDTNSQEILRAYLQLQEQLHLTQLAVEQNRREARESATQSSEALTTRLLAIEQALQVQHARELETMQSSNRALLLIAGTFAVVGFAAMLLMSFFQWRTVNRLAQLPATPARPALAAPDSAVVNIGPAEPNSLRLLGAMEKLEKRLHQLEQSTENPQLASAEHATNGITVLEQHGSSDSPALTEAAPKAAAQDERIRLLLGKGQSMLSLDDVQAAISCFDQALALDPDNAEAWVRKGSALERLQQLDQAVECYDRAINSDRSLTIAYLHKGGLYNRMERFNEALECYEKALRTQERRHG